MALQRLTTVRDNRQLEIYWFGFLNGPRQDKYDVRSDARIKQSLLQIADEQPAEDGQAPRLVLKAAGGGPSVIRLSAADHDRFTALVEGCRGFNPLFADAVVAALDELSAADRQSE
jgi:hypothetical protein